MWRDLQPEATRIIGCDGHRLVAYIDGQGDDVLLLLNGGPGLSSDHLRAPHQPLVEQGWRVVIHDQLGTGASDKPDDPSLWTMARYVDEVETVRRALDLGNVHLLGHSWGGWLAIEYAMHHPDAVKSLVLANTCADIPHLVDEAGKLKAALGAETAAMMAACEREGRFDDPDYLAAVGMLDRRHVFTLAERPEPSLRSMETFNLAIYQAMQGPNEYVFTGNLKDWSRADGLSRLAMPVLIVAGRHDVMTPACVERMAANLPDVEIAMFENSSHVPHYEEHEAYIETVADFLDRQRAA